MLYNLLYQFADQMPVLNLFRYITFRTGGAIITSLILAFVIGPHLINWLRSKQSEGQPIREDGPESHLLTKKGTPTMGGLLLLLCTSIGTLLISESLRPAGQTETSWSVFHCRRCMVDFHNTADPLSTALAFRSSRTTCLISAGSLYPSRCLSWSASNSST